MNESAVKSTLAGLVARIEALQAENVELRAKNHACAEAVTKLVAKVQNLQAINAELGLASKAQKPVDYRKRPPVMQGRTVQSNVGCGPLYITLNEDESGRPFEVFFKLGKSGSCQQSYLEALGVAISVGLRYGADPQKFIEKFEGMRCPNPKMRDAAGPSTLSCADGISQGLAKALALALPLADLNPRGEADVVAVAEPRPHFTAADKAEISANQMSIDLIGQVPSNGGSQMASLKTLTELPTQSVRKAMSTGVGMCPKCGGNLISQGGCIQCLQQCGYVGKCS
jgi:ribonucleoside-diphosphate reductase alpha chain